jgi:hypothetical protein
MHWLVASQQFIVFADIVEGSKNVKTVAQSLAFAIVVVGLALLFFRDETRRAYRGIPLIIIIALLGASAGVVALRGFGLSIIDLATGG